MRCYFHLVHGREIIPDVHGVEIANPAELEAEVTRAVYEIARETDVDEHLQDWSLEVTDEAGSVAAVVPFERALRCGNGAAPVATKRV